MSWVTAAACLLAVLGLGTALVTLRHVEHALKTSHEAVSSPSLSRFLARLPYFGKRYVRLIEDVSSVSKAGQIICERYDIVTNNTAAAIMLHEPDGSVSWASPFTEVLTGYSTKELTSGGKEFFQSHVHEDERDAVRRGWAIVATGEAYHCRYRFYHRSGMVLWLEARTVPIPDPETDSFVSLSITIDMTASVLNQQQIEERSRDLHEFTYMISHDLKAPLVTIRGMLTMLSEDSATHDSSIREPLQYIERSTDRLEQLVGGILELAKVSAVERVLQPVSLEQVVDEVRRDFESSLTKLGATLHVDENLPTILGQHAHVYRIFSNLVGNSIKYRSTEKPLAVSIRSRATRSRRRVSIEIEDNGTGIAPEQRERAFKPFQRLGESDTEGTGIGLASVKKLMEKSGGSVEILDGSDGGVVFVLEFRRADTGPSSSS